MARKKSISTTELNAQDFNGLGIQLEKDLTGHEKAGVRLEKFKKLTSAITTIGFITMVFSSHVTLFNWIVLWLSLKGADFVGQKMYEGTQERAERSQKLLQELLKDNSYTDAFDQLLHFSLRSYLLENLAKQVLAQKSEKELNSLGLNPNNCFTLEFRNHTFKTLFGQWAAKEIAKFEKRSKQDIAVHAESVLKTETLNIKLLRKKLGDPEAILDPQQFFAQNCAALIVDMVGQNKWDISSQVSYLQRAHDSQKPGASSYFSRLAQTLPQYQLPVLELLRQNTLQPKQVSSLIQVGYSLSLFEHQELAKNYKAMPLEEKENYRSVLVALAQQAYQNSAKQEHITPELEITLGLLGSNLPARLKNSVLKNFPEAAGLLGVESAPSTPTSTPTVSSHSQPTSYQNIVFEFADPQTETAWKSLVANLETIEHWQQPQSGIELSMEHKVNTKKITTSTLPELFNIYQSLPHLPQSSQAVILKEIASTIHNTLSLTQEVIDEQAQEKLRAAQVLRTYTEAKRMTARK